MIALRPDQDGRIAAYDGADELQRRFGDAIVKQHFPPIGSGTGEVSGGYHANAWLTMRHPDYDTLRSMLDWVGENVKVRAR